MGGIEATLQNVPLFHNVISIASTTILTSLKSCTIDNNQRSLITNKKPRFGKMMQRDIYQRKAYAIRRMSLAINRLKHATTPYDREKATCWIKIWGDVSRIRQFKLGNGGSDRR
jgi:hypothetical protein